MNELYEVFGRARWDAASWDFETRVWRTALRARVRDGGAVLAVIEYAGKGCLLTVNGKTRVVMCSFYAGQRAARKALREARWERAVSADDIEPGQMFVELADGSRWVVAQ